MFCKYCGKEITNDSVFCSHCGKSQNSSNKTLANKPVWIVYIIWAVSNFYLLMGEKSYKSNEYFFPNGYRNNGTLRHPSYYEGLIWDKDFYDFSEFIFYVFITPAILFVIYKLYYKIISNKLNK